LTTPTNVDRSMLLSVSDYLRTIGNEVISDVLRRLGSTNFSLKGLQCITSVGTDGNHVAGPAFTIHRALANLAHAPSDDVRQGLPAVVKQSQRGDVVVVAAQASSEAVWGDFITQTSKQHGVAGVVVDGCVRNSPEVKRLNLPVFSRGVNYHTSAQPILAYQVPIVVGAAIVRPNDIIVGDEEGVLVVASELCPQIVDEVKHELVGRV
jgi:regulator of RNase E activity RraA